MSLFGNPNSSTTSNQPQPSIFAPPTTQSGGLFGNAATANSQQGGGLFGASTTKPSLFGQSQPAQQQQQQQPSNPFGSTGFGQSAQNQQQQSQQNSAQQSNMFAQQPTLSRIWSEQQTPRQKSVAEQISLVYQKWNPQSPSSSFHAYLYNQVDPDAAPFYRPDPSENEEKWEEALRAAPLPGSIPILVKGFEQLGHRIINQERYLQLLQGRLHEINNGLSSLLRRHDLELSTRAAECKRRHIRLGQKCLALATKTQILRNRGYALDGGEEELAQKLRKLERQVLDPALVGRGEEIWARMVNVRERGRWLQGEFEKAGKTVEDGKAGAVDDEVLKQASKILEDYDKQLTHLAKELEELRSDYSQWESGKPWAKDQKKEEEGRTT
ncbi:MAG: hypothetical protein MMC23_007556 [Stictis urceolatum]|nr:hypothetical protein [Stictis urceolata]